MTRSEYLLDLRTRIANNVRFYRHSRGWTQGQMADELGVAENSIYLLENPKSRYNVPITTLASVTHALGLPLGAVLATREPPPNPRGKPARGFLSHVRNEANHESQRTKV